MKLTPRRFQQLLLSWFDVHGRKSLPWQQDKTPYRVFISEIMLQQTQVSTVIPYYERFMQHFPTLASLAKADPDEVLHLWAGLGYYSRARNLHRAAKMLMQDFAGTFPSTLAELTQLPGVGQSTAGAILAIAFNQPAAILDGNVKRVLARLHGITDPINDKATENHLWELAISHTPKQRVADYTQAMMDLGATLCTRSQPACDRCPFHSACLARANDLTSFIPAKGATKKIPTREATFLIIKHKGQVLLYQRPDTGIWGGLYSLPEFPGKPKPALVRDFCLRHWKLTVDEFLTLPPFKHTFSHYHLHIHPILLNIKKPTRRVMEASEQIWYKLDTPKAVGLPKPIQTILRGLA